MDGGQEVACGLVIARGDSSMLLELGEDVLDQMPVFVDVAVERGRVLAVRARRGDRRLASLGQ